MTSGETPLAAALHRLRSTLARVQAEAEVLELDGVAVGGIVEGLGEAFGHLGDAEDAALGGEEVAATAPGEHPRAVVLEDDERLGLLLIRQLSRAGIPAALTTSLHAAIAHAGIGGLIVADLSALGEAEESDLVALRQVTLIVTTGASTGTAADAASRLEAFRSLIKPVALPVLVSSIQEAWRAKAR